MADHRAGPQFWGPTNFRAGFENSNVVFFRVGHGGKVRNNLTRPMRTAMWPERPIFFLSEISVCGSGYPGPHRAPCCYVDKSKFIFATFKTSSSSTVSYVVFTLRVLVSRVLTGPFHWLNPFRRISHVAPEPPASSQKSGGCLG